MAALFAFSTNAWASERATTHEVVPGDTLWKIAQTHGCSVTALQRANDLTSDVLRVGVELKIPACDPTDRRADADDEAVHVVKAGDTLGRLARRYGTTVDAIVRANTLDDTVIVVGQRLRIPGREIPVRVVPGQSVGRPTQGKLVGGAQLPHDDSYYRRRPERAWGAQHVIDHTRRVIAEVKRRYPEIHRLAIGDISAPTGGRIPGHRSHQSGRDIDLGLFYERPPARYPREFVRADQAELHLDATWALLYALWKASKKPGGPERVFLDYRVQRRLYEHARRQGTSKETLAKIFQYPDGRWARGRFVAHEPHHADHFHVRFSCPPGDDLCR